MSDPTRLPTRLIDESGEAASLLERELLRAGRESRLTPEQKRKAWLGLSAVVGAAVIPAAVSAPAAAAAAGTSKALGTAALVKGTLLAIVLGGGSLVGYQVLRSRAVEVSGPPRQAVASQPAPVEPAVAPAPAPEATRPPPARRAAPATRAGHDDAHRLPASHLAAEGRVVLEARRELREGDAAGALRRLEEARTAFEDGALVQEREALTIEALRRAGRHDAAAARARDFLRAYPGSPHAASVRGFGAP